MRLLKDYCSKRHNVTIRVWILICLSTGLSCAPDICISAWGARHIVSQPHQGRIQPFAGRSFKCQAYTDVVLVFIKALEADCAEVFGGLDEAIATAGEGFGAFFVEDYF